MKTFLLASLLLLCLSASLPATSVVPKPLKEIVNMSDYIFAGEVVGVRMTNGKGKAITNPEARTGPGLDNTIWLDVAVDQNLILKSPTSSVPKKVSIPLWQMWHYTLGQIKAADHGKAFFLLNKDFQPAYPSDFQSPLSEEKKLKSIIRAQRSN